LTGGVGVSPRGDCAISAGCFLWRFTKHYPWVHLDIAGTATKRRGQGRDGQAGGASCAFPRRPRGRLSCKHFGIRHGPVMLERIGDRIDHLLVGEHAELHREDKGVRLK
jgi:hypothetical protein